jgi:guanylate kinase
VLYGICIDEIESAAAAGLVCILSIFAGPEGAGTLKEIFGQQVVSIGLVASSADINTQLAVLEDRLVKRGRDSREAIEVRLKHQPEQIMYIETNPLVETPSGKMRVFDEIVTNDDLSIATEKILSLFDAMVLGPLGEE